MIDLLAWSLRKCSGCTCVTYLGTMPLKQRNSILYRFQHDPEVSVLIMSLRAGGEGLNLQAANYVLIVEPWWNPAVEDQAIQRCHRIGQTREVHAIRFVASDTIESRMMELQEKKRLVFQGTIDSQTQAFSELCHEDLQFLFH
uniref:ATP-dependent helicase rhp16 n=1 Tax=Lygus hesperus TaxID=30085 RepID=A0A0A9YKM9_LYGHE